MSRSHHRVEVVWHFAKWVVSHIWQAYEIRTGQQIVQMLRMGQQPIVLADQNRRGYLQFFDFIFQGIRPPSKGNQFGHRKFATARRGTEDVTLEEGSMCTLFDRRTRRELLHPENNLSIGWYSDKRSDYLPTMSILNLLTNHLPTKCYVKTLPASVLQYGIPICPVIRTNRCGVRL